MCFMMNKSTSRTTIAPHVPTIEQINAIEINPNSYKFLVENVKLNKINEKRAFSGRIDIVRFLLSLLDNYPIFTRGLAR